MNKYQNIDIGEILLNKDLEIELQSPDNEYTFIYSTQKVAKEIENPNIFIRYYWLIVHSSKSKIDAPWDKFIYEKQKVLVENLIKFSNYKIVRVSRGWICRCNLCKNEIEGKIWRNIPKNCDEKINTIKCEGEYTDVKFLEY